MKFVDRIREQAVLQTALESKASSFIVIYGRRRLGKSTLIRRVLKDGDIYFEANLSEKTTQLSLLARTIGTEYPGFDSPVYSSWEDIIMAFNYRCKENATLVLDEFPYLVQKDPALPSNLQRILDLRLPGIEKLRCNIIICGSSQRMMHGLLLGSEPLMAELTAFSPCVLLGCLGGKKLSTPQPRNLWKSTLYGVECPSTGANEKDSALWKKPSRN